MYAPTSLCHVPSSVFVVQKYVRKIGACLVQLEQAHDSKVKTMMETLTNESSRLVGCIKLLNHSLHQALLMGKMDDSLSNSHKLGGAFYTNLSVSAYQALLHGSMFACN